jgi:predicted N-acetyltransferase YhbS
MAIEVRAAEAGEEEAVVPLYEWLFEPPGSRPGAWDKRRAAVALRDAIDSHDACVLVADDGGELVGICTAYQDIHSVRFGYRAWVEDLAVHPERRSQGVA